VALIAAVPLMLASLAFTTAASPPRMRSLVLRIADLTVGTTDEELVRKLGQGCFVPDEPHQGGRYFVDQQRTLTLHTWTGADGSIGAIELSEGQLVPKECTRGGGEGLVSGALSSRPAVDFGLRLGMSENELVDLLGPPDEREARKGTLNLCYQATSETDPRVLSEYTGCFTFWKKRLVSMMITDND
jgi:hypothetical protein